MAIEFDMEVAELLVATGIVASFDLDRVHAAKRGRDIRNALISNRAVTEKMWNAAVQVVKLIRDGKLPKEQSRSMLNLVGNTGMPIDEALLKLGHEAPASNPWEEKLKELTESGRYKAAQ